MITPCPLTRKEIARLMDVLGFSPVADKPGDQELMDKTGLIQWYDDERDTVEKTEGAEEAFFEYTPNARVRNVWRSEESITLPGEDGREYYREHEEEITAEKAAEAQRYKTEHITDGI
jgi:hypothetical protein